MYMSLLVVYSAFIGLAVLVALVFHHASTMLAWITADARRGGRLPPALIAAVTKAFRLGWWSAF